MGVSWTRAAIFAMSVSAAATAAVPAVRAVPAHTASRAAGPPDRCEARTVDGVPVRMVTVDLRDPRVHVGVVAAAGCPHGDEPFDALVRRSRATIAVDGAYFSKASLAPIGDIVCGGRTVYRGMMGTALAITRDKTAVIRRVKWGHAEDWSEYETVLGCGPALVLNGHVDIAPDVEGFHDPHVMCATRRVGVGLTGAGRMVIVTTLAPVTFHMWAAVMRDLGCSDAMNLDAGASTALYYRGRTLASPSRRLTNLLVVRVDR